MSTMALSAREVERITVFQYAEPFPIFDAESGIVAYVIDPSNGRIVAEARTMDEAIRPILRQGMIAYAAGDLPDENGEEIYWTSERLQRLFDHNRQRYVNCDV